MKEITEEIIQSIYRYLRSDGPGGKQIIGAFMEEFAELSKRSPPDDPTNLKNHMSFLLKHVKSTWDQSLSIDEAGNISIGVGEDSVLGFKEDRVKLKHNPTPVVWTVFLIRGIGGRYAFVNEATYFKKHRQPMPPQYYGGFLISEKTWIAERWDEQVGPFEQFEHPASGAPPIPFFKNVMHRINMEDIIASAIAEAEKKNAIN